MMPYSTQFNSPIRCLECGTEFQEEKDVYVSVIYCPACRLVHSLDRLIEVLEMMR